MKAIYPLILGTLLIGACADNRLAERLQDPGMTDGASVAAGDVVGSVTPARDPGMAVPTTARGDDIVIVSHGFDTADADYLPRTRACRQFIALSREGRKVPYHLLVARYDSCLDSDRNHPTSRRLSCGTGKYYHMRNGRRVCA